MDKLYGSSPGSDNGASYLSSSPGTNRLFASHAMRIPSSSSLLSAKVAAAGGVGGVVASSSASMLPPKGSPLTASEGSPIFGRKSSISGGRSPLGISGDRSLTTRKSHSSIFDSRSPSPFDIGGGGTAAGGGRSKTGSKTMQELLTSVNSIVKNRTGTVLSRQTILKSDHFDTGVNYNLDFHLQGAPNFRMSDLNVFGVAQPTVSGIGTILTLLSCHPGCDGDHRTTFISAREEPVIYINWRPFVLRENENPFQNIKTYQGISGSRLEQMEARLKEDIIREANRCNNLLLVHDEIEHGYVVPSWVALDDIKTTKEVFESLQHNGHRVTYVRIPISPEQAPEDRYLDEFVKVIKSTNIQDPLVFNCGMGVGRTTFAMTVALLTRRAQLLSQGIENPMFTPFSSKDSMSELFKFDEAQTQNRAMLRLVYVLEKGLSSKMSPRSAIDWALARGPLIDDLKNAVLGNYQCILQLASVLQSGAESKKLLDEVINRCDAMINLREVILLHRVRYSNTGDMASLEKAIGCLERYFFLLAFSSYVTETIDLKFDIQFSEWLRSRIEIWRMLSNLRREGPRLDLFRPVDDLSVFSEDAPSMSGWSRAPSRPIANELEKFVIKGRQGSVLAQNTILKLDQWSTESKLSVTTVDGAANFRKISKWPLYGVAQPTIQGIKNVLKALSCPPANSTPDDFGKARFSSVCWINLREEPICYINGQPFVLRDQSVTLRNIRSYSGITSSRLEQIELRLKEDIVSELKSFDSRVLVHWESSDSEIKPMWEDCVSENVLTVQDVYSLLEKEGDKILYYRVPMTAENPPEDADFDMLLQILSTINLKDTAIVLNCQIGLGRSTTGLVIASMILHWLNRLSILNLNKDSDAPIFTNETYTIEPSPHPPKPLNYPVIQSLLRVIRNGSECRDWVEYTIDQCGAGEHLRNSIEKWRTAAEVAEKNKDDIGKKRCVRKGLVALKRYFTLIAFAAYLESHGSNCELGEHGDGDLDKERGRDGLESFTSWMESRKEFDTILEEMERGDLNSLIPVENLSPGDGIALTTEVLEVVNSRCGSVLAKQTILKVDVFPGAQKLSLIERVEGAPNFRRIHLPTIASKIYLSSASLLDVTDRSVFGIGMPTKEAIRTTLNRIGAGPGGSIRACWTSLREEPVLYVKGRPFVLRLFQDPLKNLEATGIERERVELMEARMKADCINEIKRYGGRVLLHEEESKPEGFMILPVWETVAVDEIETPLEVYNSILADGFQVDYKRIPITDEQAPIPDVFDQLVDRLLTLDSNSHAIFNCQMGRGRTTTGIVIACLMEIIVPNAKRLCESQRNSEPEEEDIFESSHDLHPSVLDNLHISGDDTYNDDSEEDRIKERYLKGEYKIILQLLGVLENGRLAKYLTDSAIDSCEHMQNLRKAIYDYKLRVEALEAKTRKWAILRDIGLNYLIRYFYLIVFADYLLEEMSAPSLEDELLDLSTEDSHGDLHTVSGKRLRPAKSFKAWLDDRREISNICKRGNQTLD
ncbi:hypothetical protein HDV05_004169 [Chytridiales sp. JEL 0842]|nr:hypothetical protein HDV05_004169 [Chytridiales sp. JEL 0842]